MSRTAGVGPVSPSPGAGLLCVCCPGNIQPGGNSPSTLGVGRQTVPGPRGPTPRKLEMQAFDVITCLYRGTRLTFNVGRTAAASQPTLCCRDIQMAAVVQLAGPVPQPDLHRQRGSHAAATLIFRSVGHYRPRRRLPSRPRCPFSVWQHNADQNDRATGRITDQQVA